MDLKEHILVIDDDEALSQMIGLSLKQEGYAVSFATDGLAGLKAAQDERPDVVILDIMMPRLDGWEVCRRLKETSTTPVIVLTARVTENDLLKSFECGADDHLRKPFSLSELKARVKALIRATSLARSRQTATVLRNRELELDVAAHRASLAGKPIKLTPTEFRLLLCFMQNPGKLLSHAELLTNVWGPEYAEEDQYLRLYIRYLREKLQDDPSNPTFIFSVRGEGYRFRQQ